MFGLIIGQDRLQLQGRLLLLMEQWLELFQISLVSQPDLEPLHLLVQCLVVVQLKAAGKDFKARGIPIDGVGLQTHSAGDYPGTGAEIGANIKRLVDLGVKVEITELDVVDAPNGDQPGRYVELGKACKDNGCSGVTTWGLYDGATWLSGRNPLLLDGNFQQKPAYTSLINAIK